VKNRADVESAEGETNGGMVNIESPTAENRRGKKKKEETAGTK